MLLPVKMTLNIALLFLAVGSATSVHAASDCTALIPPGGAYDKLRSWSSTDFQLAIDDYVYQKDYKTHDQAISDGLSVGAIVYGVPLKINNTFSQTEKDSWKRQYESRTKLNKIINNRDSFEKLTLNKDAIREISYCIIATTGVGLHASYEMVDGCVFKYSASYRGPKVTDPTARVLGPLRATGGACDAWPIREVLPGAITVICRRRGRDGVLVTLPTDAGSADTNVPPLPDPGPQPNPPINQTRYQSGSGEQRADKNSSTTGAGLGEGSELKVVITAPGEITNISYRCEGGSCGWVYVCPDGGKCGGYTSEFDKNGNTATWHAWTNSGDPATLIFSYSYQTPYQECVKNCNYESDLAAWRQEAKRSCPR